MVQAREKTRSEPAESTESGAAPPSVPPSSSTPPSSTSAAAAASGGSEPRPTPPPSDGYQFLTAAEAATAVATATPVDAFLSRACSEEEVKNVASIKRLLAAINETLNGGDEEERPSGQARDHVLGEIVMSDDEDSSSGGEQKQHEGSNSDGSSDSDSSDSASGSGNSEEITAESDVGAQEEAEGTEKAAPAAAGSGSDSAAKHTWQQQRRRDSGSSESKESSAAAAGDEKPQAAFPGFPRTLAAIARRFGVHVPVYHGSLSPPNASKEGCGAAEFQTPLITRWSRRFTGNCNNRTDIKEAKHISSAAWRALCGPQRQRCPSQLRLNRNKIQEGREGYIIAGSDCGRAMVWDAATGRLIASMWSDEDVVNCINVSS